MTRRGAVALLSLALCACGPGAGAETPAIDALSPHVLYPLAEGNVWSYDVDTGTGISTLAITRVVSRSGDRFEVSNNGSEPVVYEHREGGIFRPGQDAWLLPAPIEPYAEWPSAAGMSARVVNVDERVTTEAGSFEGCVKVVESGGADGRSIETIYCPGVGPVVVRSELVAELSGMTVVVEARLRGHMLAE